MVAFDSALKNRDRARDALAVDLDKGALTSSKRNVQRLHVCEQYLHEAKSGLETAQEIVLLSIPRFVQRYNRQIETNSNSLSEIIKLISETDIVTGHKSRGGLYDNMPADDIWANAFIRRIYRDATGSVHFREKVCTDLTQAINKGNRPAWVDEFTVTHINFGWEPPLLRNIVLQKGCIDVNNSSPYDVMCSAYMHFKCVQFNVESKILINWPTDRYGMIPLHMSIDILEMEGNVRFGVNKLSSEFSFLSEPQTTIHVQCRLGSEYNFTKIPALSDIVLKRIKNMIMLKTVFPHFLQFPLPWPKSWWPQASEENATRIISSGLSSTTLTDTPTKAPVCTKIALEDPEPAGDTEADSVGDSYGWEGVRQGILQSTKNQQNVAVVN